MADNEKNRRLVIESVLALVSVVSALATLGGSAQGAVWQKVLISAVGLAAVVMVGPPLSRRLMARVRRARVRSRLRQSWQRFSGEVSDRRRFFDHLDGRGLNRLLTSLRGRPEDAAGANRLHYLANIAPAVLALNGAVLAIGQLVALGWPGERQAKSIVNAFESLFDFPSNSGLVQQLKAQAIEPTDAKLIEEWLGYYDGSRADYGKFARNENRENGEKLFGEHFGA